MSSFTPLDSPGPIMHSLFRSALATFVFAFGIASGGNASVFIVDQSGAGDFTSIQDAIVAASDGDTILVRAGYYFDGIHIDGKSLAIMAQDPQNPPWIIEDYEDGGPKVFLIENLMQGQGVVLDHLRLRMDVFDGGIEGAKGTLTIRECRGSVRVQSCELYGGWSMCALCGPCGSPYSCNQTGGAHVSGSSDVFFVGCTIAAGYIACWKDVEGSVNCGGTPQPALRVEVGLAPTNVALYDSHVIGTAGRDPIDPQGYDGWDGGTAAEISDSFVFASNTIFEGGQGSDADSGSSPHTPGEGGNGGDALVLSNAVMKELNCSFLGGQPGSGAPCDVCDPPLPPGRGGLPGAGVTGCCLESLSGPVRSAHITGNQIVPGKLGVTFTGIPGDQVDLALSAGGGFAYQPDRLGVLGLASPVTLVGGASPLGTLPATGELSLLVDYAVAPGTQADLQPVFSAGVGEKALGPPFRVFEAPGCNIWVHCNSLPNSTGSPAALTASGTSSHGANDLVLSVSQLPPAELGMFFYSLAPATGWGNWAGDGVLCSGGALFRLQPALVASAQGTASRAIDMQMPPMNSGAGALENGARAYFQYVYRDAQSPGPEGFNFSNGLTVEICP